MPSIFSRVGTAHTLVTTSATKEKEEVPIIENEPVKIASPMPITVGQGNTKTFAPQLSNEQPAERGRTLRREPLLESREDGDKELGEILDVVRSRLYSVQNMVRRERSGSSHAKDDMMDELGNMLDDAIATTMTPVRHSNTLGRMVKSHSRHASISSAKQSLPTTTTLSRSQSLKVSGPSHSRFYDRRKEVASDISSASGGLPVPAPPPASPARPLPGNITPQEMPRKSSVTPRESVQYKSAQTQLLESKVRQISQPMMPSMRPPGFPFTSPVRERRLL